MWDWMTWIMLSAAASLQSHSCQICKHILLLYIFFSYWWIITLKKGNSTDRLILRSWKISWSERSLWYHWLWRPNRASWEKKSVSALVFLTAGQPQRHCALWGGLKARCLVPSSAEGFICCVFVSSHCKVLSILLLSIFLRGCYLTGPCFRPPLVSESEHHSVSGLVSGSAEADASEGGGDPERQQVSPASVCTGQTWQVSVRRLLQDGLRSSCSQVLQVLEVRSLGYQSISSSTFCSQVRSSSEHHGGLQHSQPPQ